MGTICIACKDIFILIYNTIYLFFPFVRELHHLLTGGSSLSSPPLQATHSLLHRRCEFPHRSHHRPDLRQGSPPPRPLSSPPQDACRWRLRHVHEALEATGCTSTCTAPWEPASAETSVGGTLKLDRRRRNRGTKEGYGVVMVLRKKEAFRWRQRRWSRMYIERLESRWQWKIKYIEL